MEQTLKLTLIDTPLFLDNLDAYSTQLFSIKNIYFPMRDLATKSLNSVILCPYGKTKEYLCENIKSFDIQRMGIFYDCSKDAVNKISKKDDTTKESVVGHIYQHHNALYVLSIRGLYLDRDRTNQSHRMIRNHKISPVESVIRGCYEFTVDRYLIQDDELKLIDTQIVSNINSRNCESVNCTIMENNNSICLIVSDEESVMNYDIINKIKIKIPIKHCLQDQPINKTVIDMNKSATLNIRHKRVMFFDKIAFINNKFYIVNDPEIDKF